MRCLFLCEADTAFLFLFLENIVENMLPVTFQHVVWKITVTSAGNFVVHNIPFPGSFGNEAVRVALLIDGSIGIPVKNIIRNMWQLINQMKRGSGF